MNDEMKFKEVLEERHKDKILDWLDETNGLQINWARKQFSVDRKKFWFKSYAEGEDEYKYVLDCLVDLSKGRLFEVEFTRLKSRWSSYLHNYNKQERLSKNQRRIVSFELSKSVIKKLKQLTKDDEQQSDLDTLESLINGQYGVNLESKNKLATEKEKSKKAALEFSERSKRGNNSMYISKLKYNQLKEEMVRLKQKLINAKVRLKERDLLLEKSSKKLDFILKSMECLVDK